MANVTRLPYRTTTGTGTQNVRPAALSGITPKGAEIWVTSASVDDTATIGALLSVGLVDSGGRQGASAFAIEDTAGSSTEANRSIDTSNAISMLAQDGTSKILVGAASLVSGGMDIVWGTALAGLQMTIKFYHGSDLACYVSTGPTLSGTLGGSITVSGLPFTPNYWRMHYFDCTANTTEVWARASVGSAYDNGVTIDQMCTHIQARDNASTSEMHAIVRDSAVGYSVGGNEELVIHTPVSGAYQIRSDLSGSGEEFVCMAMDVGDLDVEIGIDTTQTSATTKVTTLAGSFVPASVSFMATMNTSLNTLQTSGDNEEAFSLGVSDGTNEATVAISSEGGISAPSMDAGSRVSANALLLINGGDEAEKSKASMTATAAGTFTNTYAVSDAAYVFVYDAWGPAVGGGTPPPTITNVDTDNSITADQLNVVIAGTDFDTATVELRQTGVALAQSLDAGQTATSIQFDVVYDGTTDLRFGAAITNLAVINTDLQEDLQAIALLPEANELYIDLSGYNASAPGSLTAVPALVDGDQIHAQGVAGGAVPTGLILPATGIPFFDSGNTPEAFRWRAYDISDKTWGSFAQFSVGGSADVVLSSSLSVLSAAGYVNVIGDTDLASSVSILDVLANVADGAIGANVDVTSGVSAIALTTYVNILGDCDLTSSISDVVLSATLRMIGDVAVTSAPSEVGAAALLLILGQVDVSSSLSALAAAGSVAASDVAASVTLSSALSQLSATGATASPTVLGAVDVQSAASLCESQASVQVYGSVDVTSGASIMYGVGQFVPAGFIATLIRNSIAVIQFENGVAAIVAEDSSTAIVQFPTSTTDVRQS